MEDFVDIVSPTTLGAGLRLMKTTWQTNCKQFSIQDRGVSVTWVKAEHQAHQSKPNSVKFCYVENYCTGLWDKKKGKKVMDRVELSLLKK